MGSRGPAARGSKGQVPPAAHILQHAVQLLPRLCHALPRLLAVHNEYQALREWV